MIRVPTYDEIATYLRALPEAERHAAALRYKHELGLDPRKLLSAAATLPVLSGGAGAGRIAEHLREGGVDEPAC